MYFLSFYNDFIIYLFIKMFLLRKTFDVYYIDLINPLLSYVISKFDSFLRAQKVINLHADN